MPDAPVSAPAPAAPAPSAPSTPAAPSTSTPSEPKVTWGSPDAIESTTNPAEKVGGEETTEQHGADEFGDEGFDD